MYTRLTSETLLIVLMQLC